ncbi:MAG: transcriptional regulator PadR family protein [Gemmatimonadetes bacterium]|nr:transcriptional regulator PadR family protein [Gemmatimonadota bacterium]
MPVSHHPAQHSAPDSLRPLKPVELLVLTMLSAGERHGYGIRQDIIDHTRGAIALEAGNLYRTIRRLETDGLLDESSRRPSAQTDDERRRYYRLSPFGRRVLAAELERLRALVRLGEERRVIAPLPA